MDSYEIILDEYEIANLKALINAIGYPSCGPDAGDSIGHMLAPLQTGDWLGQIYNKLPPVQFKPNSGAKEMRQSVTDYWNFKAL